MASPSFSQPRASVLPFGREKKEPATKQNPHCRVRHRWIGTRPKVYIRDANARTPMCMLQSGVSYWTILACPKSDSTCSILIALAWQGGTPKPDAFPGCSYCCEPLQPTNEQEMQALNARTPLQWKHGKQLLEQKWLRGLDGFCAMPCQ